MVIYALSTLPLLSVIKTENVRYVAYADDLSGAGKIGDLRKWWGSVVAHGPSIGYYPNSFKSWIIVKPEKLKEAERIFSNTNINITIDGKRHLGAVIGSDIYKEEYVNDLVRVWVSEITMLSEIAKIYPQSAYCAFTAGYVHKFT